MGPKGKKKTKAELEEEKAAREEEERKAKIAEEKRQAEEKEKKRQELAKLAAEQKALREKELERWRVQYGEILDQRQSNEQQLQAEERQEEAHIEWTRFREPNDEPDAEVEKDMNTFISQARETVPTDLKETMTYIKGIEKLAKAVEDVWVNSVAKKDFVKRDRALRDLKQLHELVLEKIDQATMPILRYYEKHINDKFIMHIDEIASQISVGMWASYEEPRPTGMKRPQPWESTGAHLEVIPKNLLQQSDRYIFRVIRTPIVTYNLEAYHDDVLPEIPQPDGKDDADSSLKRPASVDTLALDKLSKADGASPSGEEKPSGAESTEAKDGEGAADAPTTPTNEGSAGESTKKKGQSALPTYQFAGHQTKFVVGDLIHFEILVAPPAPFQLRVKRWTLRDSSAQSTAIRKSDYPTSSYCKLWLKIPDSVVMSDDLRLCVWNAEKKDWVEEGIAEFQYNEALRMVQCNLTTVGVFALVKNRTVDLPLKNFAMYPVLTKKVNDLMNYRNDATMIPTYLRDTLDLQGFHGLPAISNKDNNGGGAMGLVPATYERHARMVVQTQVHEIVIDIIGSQVCLIKPREPFVQDMLGVPMTPGALLLRLYKKGINLLPTDVDLFSVTNGHLKIRLLENEVLDQISGCASALEFHSSPWNKTLSESQIGLLARESTVYTCPTEENEYECILVERDEVSVAYQNTPELGLAPGPDGIQYALVYGNEYGRRPLFSPVLRPGEERHMELSRTLFNRISPEAMQRIQRTNQRFRRTVYTLLSLLKVYSLS